jgi:hypothetical protein
LPSDRRSAILAAGSIVNRQANQHAMKTRPFVFPSIAIAALALSTALGAAPSDVYTDPQTAPPDFQLQGEFAADGLGAQVVSQGLGAFQAVLYRGGLPGAGWDGKTRVRLDGKFNGSAVDFTALPSGWAATVRDGALHVQTGEPLTVGDKVKLDRVERHSPTIGAKPPEGAVVLFNGSGIDEWTNGRMTPDGLLESGSRTKRSFKDFTLHVEFRIPYKPEARGQSRGNSGVYIFSRYEIQILDSFGLDGKNNECGAVYQQKPPSVNMCLPPLAWQTYDIDFKSPRYDEGGNKTQNGVITVRHNGVVVHDNYELPSATGGGKRVGETGAGGPIAIQNHGNPVRLRNVWIVER